jgi:hypothetical protein
VTELTPAELRRTDVDLVILQRPSEIALVRDWLGRAAGIDLPAIYLEHNTPDQSPCLQRHVVADRRDITIVHVTHFNELFWDNGSAPTTVIEHGIIDPGDRYTGRLDRGAVVVNEPGRRGRTVGADLLPLLAQAGPIDLFGMQADAFVRGLGGQSADRIHGHEDLATQDDMHTKLGRRRVYLHPMRWTSLGLSLIEAMQLAMPVVVVASTDAVAAVPPGAGVISTDVDRLVDGFRTFRHEPELARACGLVAREAALERYGLKRFLRDWDQLIHRTVGERGGNR